VRNNQRLFDSQNNNAGGYQVGDDCNPVCSNAATGTYDASLPGAGKGQMYFYEHSYLHIEWTNQHGCGSAQKNVKCDLILQYTCDEEGNYGLTNPNLRDGSTTSTVPVTEAGAADEQYGGARRTALSKHAQLAHPSSSAAANPTFAATCPAQCTSLCRTTRIAASESATRGSTTPTKTSTVKISRRPGSRGRATTAGATATSAPRSETTFRSKRAHWRTRARLSCCDADRPALACVPRQLAPVTVARHRHLHRRYGAVRALPARVAEPPRQGDVLQQDGVARRASLHPAARLRPHRTHPRSARAQQPGRVHALRERRPWRRVGRVWQVELPLAQVRARAVCARQPPGQQYPESARVGRALRHVTRALLPLEDPRRRPRRHPPRRRHVRPPHALQCVDDRLQLLADGCGLQRAACAVAQRPQRKLCRPLDARRHQLSAQVEHQH
jgi:hypothetical protein